MKLPCRRCGAGAIENCVKSRRVDFSQEMQEPEPEFSDYPEYPEYPEFSEGKI